MGFAEIYNMDKLITTTIVTYLLASTFLLIGSTGQAGNNRGSAAASRYSSMGYSGFTEQKLDAFAAAYVKVARIYRSHADQVKSAQNAQQAYKAQAVIDSKMSEAIQEEGLSPDEYNAVVRTINEDPALGQAVAQKIRSLQ
jgi:hypothetical protein